jgi:hypothetical protein
MSDWRPGLPPDMNVHAWEVFYTFGGLIWHRRKVMDGGTVQTAPRLVQTGETER